MANLNDKFSALSMKDRAELINIYVKGGMMDLKEIKAHYNSLYEEKEPNKYGWGGASKEALGKAFGDASSAVTSTIGIAGSAMTMVDNFMKNSEVDTTEADNALEATKSHQLDPSGLDALSSSYNATPWADTDVDFENFLPSTGEYISNTLSSTVSGLATGAQVGGPWGAVIGGVVGLGSAVGGIFAGREKAKLEEARLEAAAKKANTAIENKAIDARNNIIQQQTNSILRNIAADGGRILKGDEDEQTLSGKPWYQLDPKRIVKNVPAREWGPYELKDDGSGTYKRGTRFIDSYRNYKDDKHEYGKQNEIVVDETLKKGDKNEKYYEDAIAYKNHLEALKKYLKLPYDESYIAESEHQPTKSIGTDDVYYRFTNQTPDYWSDVVDDMLLRERNEKQYLDPTLNTFTAYRDRDDKGDFISIYDTWDYSPTVVGGSKKMNKIIDTFTGGKGFDIYDRIYLDDYFGVPEEAKGNAFITPVIVQGVKKDTEQMLKSLGIPKEKWNEYLDKEYKSGGKLKKSKINLHI